MVDKARSLPRQRDIHRDRLEKKHIFVGTHSCGYQTTLEKGTSVQYSEECGKDERQPISIKIPIPDFTDQTAIYLSWFAHAFKKKRGLLITNSKSLN